MWIAIGWPREENILHRKHREEGSPNPIEHFGTYVSLVSKIFREIVCWCLYLRHYFRRECRATTCDISTEIIFPVQSFLLN